MKINREIKFRGKHSDKWIYGSLIKSNDDNKYYITGNIDQFYQVKEGTIGQYTGLKDKNGVEIYEGDIIKLHHKTWIKRKGEDTFDFKNTKCYVIWDKEGAMFILNKKKNEITEKTYVDTLFMFDNETMEVIGNIYDELKDSDD